MHREGQVFVLSAGIIFSHPSYSFLTLHNGLKRFHTLVNENSKSYRVATQPDDAEYLLANEKFSFILISSQEYVILIPLLCF